MRVAPNRPAAWDLTTVAGAAFAIYARQAIDYTTAAGPPRARALRRSDVRVGQVRARSVVVFVV